MYRQLTSGVALSLLGVSEMIAGGWGGGASASYTQQGGSTTAGIVRDSNYQVRVYFFNNASGANLEANVSIPSTAEATLVLQGGSYGSITANGAERNAIIVGNNVTTGAITNTGTLGRTKWLGPRYGAGDAVSDIVFDGNNYGHVLYAFVVARGASVESFTNNGTIRGRVGISGTVGSFTNNGNWEYSADNAANELVLGGSIGTLTNNSGKIIREIRGNGNIRTLENRGTITTINKSVAISTIDNTNGIITNLETSTNNRGVFGGTFTNLTLSEYPLYIRSLASAYNAVTDTTATDGTQHIIISGTVGNLTVNSLQVAFTDGAEVGEVYKYSKVALGAGLSNRNITYGNLTPLRGQQGIELVDATHQDGEKGFMFRLNAASSYGGAILKTTVLAHLRREVLISEVLDSVTTKTFRTEYGKARATREAELDAREKALKKNKGKDDVIDIRTQRALLSKGYAKQQDIGSSYNKERLFDALDVVFVPYLGNRNWVSFVVPYGTYSIMKDSDTSGTEYAGGSLFGIHREAGKGIVGGYFGYEYAKVNADLTTTTAQAQNHSMNIGINYFQPFALTGLREYYFKVTLRGGMDMPTFSSGGIKLNLTTFSGGAEGALGATYYFLRNNSYLSPELNLSYDLLYLGAFDIIKPINIIPNEYYPAHLLHIPQVGMHLKWYKSWGNTFRTSFRVGAKYNVLNKQDITFEMQRQKDTSPIVLPNFYGTIDGNAIWAFAKRQQLSAGYTGIFASGIISNALQIKWQMWF